MWELIYNHGYNTSRGTFNFTEKIDLGLSDPAQRDEAFHKAKLIWDENAQRHSNRRHGKLIWSQSFPPAQ